MYTLILTVFALASNGGSAITHIDGFTSSASCLAAGNSWLEQTGASTPGYVANHRAICVKKG